MVYQLCTAFSGSNDKRPSPSTRKNPRKNHEVFLCLIITVNFSFLKSVFFLIFSQWSDSITKPLWENGLKLFNALYLAVPSKYILLGKRNGREQFESRA